MTNPTAALQHYELFIRIFVSMWGSAQEPLPVPKPQLNSCSRIHCYLQKHNLLRPGLGIQERNMRVKRKVTPPRSPEPYPKASLQVKVLSLLRKTENFNSGVNTGQNNKQASYSKKGGAT